MEREVRYCSAEDGTRIAYCVEGEGPAILAQPFFIESFSLDHHFPDYHDFLLKLSEGRKLIRFDPRGTGLSQRDVVDLSADAHIRDGIAVLRACEADRYVILASTITGPFALRGVINKITAPVGLVLYGTCASVSAAFPPQMLEAFAGLALANWPMACQTLSDLSGRADTPELAMRVATWMRESTTGAVASQLILQNASLDSTDRLGEIDVPTLIVHRINDPVIAFERGQEMASRIRTSRFVPLQGNLHLAPHGDQAPVLKAVRTFLDEIFGPVIRKARLEEQPPVRTVLFTDLVGHTEMMSRLGDEAGRVVLREHESITRNVLKQHGGTEVKTMGDGFMASFGSVTKAVECAISLQRAFGEREGEPLSVRVGLNAGEPIEEDGDLFGATVILASRIAAKAEGGEILVANAVRELCSGKGFLFSDFGEFVAKGFEDPVRIYLVNWRT
jgi:class 3 adenylate cyclase/pimeloyl-ACP methyl ester carboxylesterase